MEKVEKQLDKSSVKILRAFRPEINSGFPMGGLECKVCSIYSGVCVVISDSLVLSLFHLCSVHTINPLFV